MIIETKNDVVRLSGALHKNQWLTIRAGADLLLKDHPEGIIIDCSNLTEISNEGAKTFLEAMRDIEAAHSRIVVANLPEKISEVCKKIPGVRSQLAIATSVEEARSSLRTSTRPSCPGTSGPKNGLTILVPLVANLDLSYGAFLAARMAASGKADVQVVYLMEVARTMPLNAPQPESEQLALEAITRARGYAKRLNVSVTDHIERVREISDGIFQAIKTSGANIVVLGATSRPDAGDDTFCALTQMLIQRAECEVVIGRLG